MDHAEETPKAQNEKQAEMITAAELFAKLPDMEKGFILGRIGVRLEKQNPTAEKSA